MLVRSVSLLEYFIRICVFFRSVYLPVYLHVFLLCQSQVCMSMKFRGGGLVHTQSKVKNYI